MPRTWKWIIAVMSSAAMFAGTWWLCEAWLHRSSGDAIGIAAIPSALLGMVLAWWAGRDKPTEAPPPVAEAGTATQVTNTITSDQVRQAVQTNEVHGGIHFHAAPSAPVAPTTDGQVVTGLIPHEPPNFQTPEQVATLAGVTGEVCVVCAVTGQRGVGKTQVAAAYARRRVRDGWLVAWVGAETDEQIKAGMSELADQLGLRQPEDTVEATAVRVRNHLQVRRGPALIVFDNLVSLDSIRPYLPAAGRTQIVITSTTRGARLGREVPVDVFDEETALRFLREATGLTDDESAAELAREVGYLPLALGQAAARIRSGWGYAAYLDHFRKLPAEKYLTRRDGDPYPLGAATAILMALEPFEDSELVPFLAVLSPDGVSRQVLGDSADDELVLLHEASLVEFAGDSSVLMHRLVQRVVRDRFGKTGDDQIVIERGARLLCARAQFDGEAWAHRQFGNELVRQIEALSANTSAEAPRPTLEMVLTARLWAANFLADTANFTSASLIAQEAHDEAVARLGDEHPLVVHARHTVSRGTHSESMSDLMEKDLARLRKEFGDQHTDTVITLVLLSTHYVKLGRADEAIAMLERTLESWRDSSPDVEDVSDLLDALGEAYVAGGRNEDAISTLEQAVQHNATTMGPDSKPTLHTMSILGGAYFRAGRTTDALNVYEHKLNAFRRTLGSDHPLTITSAVQVAIALKLLGRRDQARALLLETQALATEVLGEDHSTTVIVRKTLEVIPQD